MSKFYCALMFTFFSMIVYAQQDVLIDSMGNVKIGIATSLENPLTVFRNQNSFSGTLINAQVFGTESVNDIAIFGKSKPTDGFGIGGSFEGGFIGLIGNANSSINSQIEGLRGQVSGTGTGIQYGVNGASTGFGIAYGINGYGATQNANSFSYGVFGWANGVGTNYGVYGSATNGTKNWAGYFEGNSHFTENVGIGALSPISRLSVGGDGVNFASIYSEYNGDNGYAIYGKSTNLGSGVYGESTLEGTTFTSGGFFKSKSNGGAGVFGISDGTFGSGVRGLSNGGGHGVYGAASGTGVYGDSSGSNGRGIQGRSTFQGSGFGYGGYFSAAALNARGILAVAEGTGTNFGVYGRAINGTTNWGGYFEGDGHFTERVGIGTTSLTGHHLHVNGADNNGVASAVKISSGGQHLLLDGNEIDAFGFDMFLNNNSDRNVIMTTGGGQVGINAPAPDAMLHIKQYDNNERAITIEDDVDDDIWSFEMIGDDLYFWFNGTQKARIDNLNGTWSPLSDRRVKKDLEYLTGDILKQVNALRPASYRYIDNKDDAMKSVGFIAQEAQKVFPAFIGKNEDQMMTLNYDLFSVLSIKSIQELSKENSDLERRISMLEIKLISQQSILEQQNKLLKRIEALEK